MDDTIISKKQVLQVAIEAIQEKVIERFSSSYNSPLNKLIDECFTEHEGILRKIVQDTLTGVFGDVQFKVIVKEEFMRKVAKNLIGKMEGTVERAADKLRQDETLKARMILAIENIINEQTS